MDLEGDVPAEPVLVLALGCAPLVLQLLAIPRLLGAAYAVAFALSSLAFLAYGARSLVAALSSDAHSAPFDHWCRALIALFLAMLFAAAC